MELKIQITEVQELFFIIAVAKLTERKTNLSTFGLLWKKNGKLKKLNNTLYYVLCTYPIY